MIIRIGFVLSLVVNFFLLFNFNSPKVSKINSISNGKQISIAAESSPLKSQLPTLCPQLNKEVISTVPSMTPDEEMNFQIDRYFENAKQYESEPSSHAIEWGKKLPVPKTKAEHALKHVLMQYYDNFYKPIEPGGQRAGIYIDLPRYFDHLDEGYTSYLTECLDKIDMKEEQKMRTQLYSIAAQSRQRFPFFKNLKEDFEYQSRYGDEDSEFYDWKLVYEYEKAEDYLKTDQSERYLHYGANRAVRLISSDTNSLNDQDERSPQ